MAKLRVTVVGSRVAPLCDCKLIYAIIHWIVYNGGKGYSGGAEGIDHTLSMVANKYFREFPDKLGSDYACIILPWSGFNSWKHGECNGAFVAFDKAVPDCAEATRIAMATHPKPSKLTRGAKSMHSRNIPQVLDLNLSTPTDAVLLSAPKGKDGLVTGGTRTAHAMAVAWMVPVFNLQDKNVLDTLLPWLDSIGLPKEKYDPWIELWLDEKEWK